MVRGLTTFREHFIDYKEQYVLIGGAASSEILSQSGLTFRATRDLDIVLIVEALSAEFGRAFWEFIEKGNYRSIFQNKEEKKCYRFNNPVNAMYPEQIELFSRIPETIDFKGYGRITPIPIDNELSSLSAIILDDNYYSLIKNGLMDINGLSCLRPAYIIILKAKAYLNMTKNIAEGENITSQKLNKHKNDVFRLFPVLEPNEIIELPLSVKNDLRDFIFLIENDTTINIKNLGIRRIGLKEVMERLKIIFNLD